MLAWLYLWLAGLAEIGWAFGLKIAQSPSARVLGFGLAIVMILISGFFLWLAQKSIPLGIAYAVWTGIGIVGTFLVSVWVFKEAATLGQIVGILLILFGIILLKLHS